MTHHVAIVGAGPAGLMAAEVLAGAGVGVTVYDRMPSVGRKLLMAGRSGLNLTHSEPIDVLLGRYGAALGWMEPIVRRFPPEALIAWCHGLGQETFVGTSGRVFPKAMKASPLLRAWLRRLDGLGVALRVRHRWMGWDADGALRFEAPEGLVRVMADATVLALGGASWPRLGSDAAWTGLLEDVAPFRPANCGLLVDWSSVLRARFVGRPLKRLAVRFGDLLVRGEAVITETGLEGGAIYAVSASVRDALVRDGVATLFVDLRPDIGLEALAPRVDGPRRGQSLGNWLRGRAGLAPEAIGLVQEALHAGAGGDLSALIKAVPVRVTGTAPLARAISSAGGVRREAVDERLMLRARPGVFLAGEMLDWEAPTGGYLLQGCFATGVAAAHGALAWLG